MGQDAQTNSGRAGSLPSLSIPKGGGAIRSIGEKFAANPVTGTGSITIPITCSPGRSGFGPQLSLSYDSGAGNGPFGLGWSLSLPCVTRKTDKGLPRYRDADDSDVFILSGAEDLVPVFKKDQNGNLVRDGKGQPVFDEVEREGHRVRRYQPRIESLFARIERWTRLSDGDTHWRSISRDNITTRYGKSPASRITDPDPDKSTHVFSWLICETYDDKGNALVYEYKNEDSQRIDISKPHEQQRSEAVRSTNRYLKTIRYGNRLPNRDAGWNPTDPSLLPANTWMFEVLFDYGEQHLTEELPDADGRIFAQTVIEPPQGSFWPSRQDSFSIYRAGFEVRTYRLCRRVLMFHHFPEELGINDYLVRALEFSYLEGPVSSFITSVTQSGYVRQPLQNQSNRYLKKSLPPLEFEYSKTLAPEALGQLPIHNVAAESLENLPAGLDGNDYQWIDLDGEGISSILTAQADGWYYKRNLSANNIVKDNGSSRVEGRFGPVEVVEPMPATSVADGAQFLDLAGDGQLDLVQMGGSVRGFYERVDDSDWAPFKVFNSWPDLNTRDPDLRFVDLTGDGHADILISEGESLTWYPSLAEEGFGPAIQSDLPRDEEAGPRFVFADGTQSIYLADLSGDGLSDLVRISNGEVCYWPNLGYGRFGRRVTMYNSPWFESVDQFDQRRIRLADTDGSGTTDILYLGRDGVRIYLNESGNGWREAIPLPQFPPLDNISSVQMIDLLGNGTACLVWSSALPGAARRQMRYLALVEEKPHLLVGINNNLGAETKITYAPSTRFYLDDKREGKPWITKIPFPVHVVAQLETLDHISHNRFVTQYKYHHGYFDGAEREFRGFGMVEQLDTEEFSTLTENDLLPDIANLDAATHVPPVLTRSWFHTGAYLDREHISDFFAGLLDPFDKGEYYREPGLNDTQARALLLPDTILPLDLTTEEEREACRSLKGLMLRQEMYALDGSSTPEFPNGHPYTVVEQNFKIRCLQSRETNQHAVFHTHPLEAISYHYEREPADPRVSHTLTLEVDQTGNVLKLATIGYGRRKTIRVVSDQGDVTEITNPGLNELAPPDQLKQTKPLITYTESRFTNTVDDSAQPNDYRTPLPAEVRTYELTGYTPTGAAGRFQASDLVKLDPDDPTQQKLLHVFDTEIKYEEDPSPGKQRRPIEHVRTLYRKNNLTTLLELGKLESLALSGESYKLAFTPGLLSEVFKQDAQPLLPIPVNILGVQGADGGGFLSTQALAGQGLFPSDLNDHWWVPSGRVFLSPETNHTAVQELDHARTHFFIPHRYRDPFHSNQVNTENVITFDAHNLLMIEMRDQVGNVVTVRTEDDQGTIAIRNDYRVLQPVWVTDPNRNRTQAVFDALGMVVATAVMGKPGANKGDNLGNVQADLTQTEMDAFHDSPNPDALAANLLKGATTRAVYDVHRFRISRQAHPGDASLWEPPYVVALARETHASDPLPPQGLKIQISTTYFDGFGREIQKKIKAEPGPVPKRGADGKIIVGADGLPVMTSENVQPRWVGSGWTVFNNKGKPIRKYEPFFTDTRRFEFDARIGVSPVFFYDPVERMVVTLHANHTYEKEVFDAWQQKSYDINDTVTFDPRTDPDIKGLVAEYFKQVAPQPNDWRSWLQQRGVDPVSPPIDTPALDGDKKAAIRTLPHADTPSTAHFDALGRTFLAIAHNKFQRKKPDDTFETIEEKLSTRVELDIEGNHRSVRDAILQNGDQMGRVVMRHAFDMLGNRILQESMDAGNRWILNDVLGNPIRTWDSRKFIHRLTYDALRRSVGSFVTENGTERLVVRTAYGEAQGDAKNHRTRVHQVFDGAGVVTSVAYDFKGNLLENRRDLLSTFKGTVDWQQNPVADDGTFTLFTEYDALNRPFTVTTPDKSVYRPSFNEANFLERVEVNLRGAASTTPFVTNIDYNAKGQRNLIEYGNGAKTIYEYDPLTFRLIHVKTTRPAGLNGLASQIFSDTAIVQDLHYTYDPAGNVTRITDDALATVANNNEQVLPVCEYRYDALYRLIEASGREHIGQSAFAVVNEDFRDFPFVGAGANPNDLQALRNYTELYEYDAVGNFTKLAHQFAQGGWNRTYAYNEPSLLEPAKQNNRLSNSAVGQTPESYTYDAHGNFKTMPHLTLMEWGFNDQLRATARQVVNNGTPETTFYVYDSAGVRARKVTERQNGSRKNERIYLGGFEVYREFNGNGQSATLQRETLHIMDDMQRIALVETMTIENAVEINTPVPQQRYQLNNHLGSASLELDQNGALISYEEYHPYGTTSFRAGTAAEVSLKRYRWTGKERDEETGFSYHGARYYAPWLGRWIACDPIGIEDGLCVYSYGKANPLKFTDPTGTTVTVQPSTIHDSNNNADISTTQAQANQAFLRDIRAGLADKEASLFQIDKSNRLVFSGDQKKLSQYSEYTQMLVGQINSKQQIVVLPALLGLAKTQAQSTAVLNGNFSVQTQGKTIQGLGLSTSIGKMGSSILGSTAVDKGTIFVTYITSTTAVPVLPKGVKPGTKLPPVAGMPPNISITQQDYFKQGNITQTLVHELAAHVEGNLKGEANNDAHFSNSLSAPRGGTTTLRDFRNDTGMDPDYHLVLAGTSKTPFERSLRLEREALANLKAKLPPGLSLGGQPDRRKADVDLIDRAEKNKAKQDAANTALLMQEFPGLFTTTPGYWQPKPVQIGQR